MAVQDVTTAPSSSRAGGRRRGRAPRQVGAVALAALALGGCSAESGDAAVVDGRAIPVSDVHTATAELRPYLDEPSPSSILAVLVAEPTVARIAGEHGVAVSQQQVRDLLARASEAVAAQGEGGAEDAPADAPAAEFSDPSLTVARFTLLQDGLRALPDAQQVQTQLFDELDALDVDVIRRFGDLDFSQGGITPVEHEWLVPPPEPAAP